MQPRLWRIQSIHIVSTIQLKWRTVVTFDHRFVEKTWLHIFHTASQRSIPQTSGQPFKTNICARNGTFNELVTIGQYISNTIQKSGARKTGNMARGDWYHLSTAIYTRLGIRRRPADKPLPTHGGHKIFQYTLQYSYYVSFQCARTSDMPVCECLR